MRRPKALRHCVALLCALILSACAQKSTSEGNRFRDAVLCDLRDTQEHFGGQEIKVEGWIYTDLERFGLSNGKCSIGLLWPDEPPSGVQGERFNRLLQQSKNGGFNSDHEVFVILAGKFLISETKIGNDVWRPGHGAGQSPSVLLIEREVCSVIAPMNRFAQAQAHKMCQSK
jgi:hypothetical protein